MSETPVKLSICIPTHHSRAWCLREALASILDDIEASGISEAVEIVVSDNGSHDDTSEVIASAQERAPGLIRYFRFPLSVGIYSWFNVIEMARGEYCWLFGSDDVLEPGAIVKMLDVLARFPNCAGITAAYEHYDFRMERKLPLHPLAYYPDDYHHERQINGFRDCLEQLGMAQGFMSVQCFRRELWMQAIAAESLDFIHYVWHYTHTYILARMMQRAGNWVWAPFTAMKMRGENGEVPARLGNKAYLLTNGYLRDMASLWSRVCERDRSSYRRVLAKALSLSWSPSVVRHLKMSATHDSHDDAVLLKAFIRYLWPLPQFWLRTMPALLVPHGVWKMLSRSHGYDELKVKFRRRSA